MNRRLVAAGVVVVLAAGLSACQWFAARGPRRTLSPDELVNTAAAQTVAALGTEIAQGQNPTLVGAASSATDTPAATPAPSTPSPTSATATPQQSPSLSPSQTGAPCTNMAGFVRDVSVPDGAVILPRFTFVKTWELKNTGTCTWDAGYAVVFADRGNSMNGAQSTPILTSGQVKPGDNVQVSVTLRAPSKLGDYTGNWELRSADNQLFGTGPKADVPFYVKIKVDNAEFSFADYTCSARWTSGGGDFGGDALPCPGKTGDSKGYVLALQNPALEDGKTREGPGWETMALPSGGGWIVGRFQPLVVPDHADFRTTLSCQPDAKTCYIRFRITYQVDNGPEQELGSWNEGYDGNVTEVIKDLNMLGGKSTAFNFYLYVSGAPDQSRGMWYSPRIVLN